MWRFGVFRNFGGLRFGWAGFWVDDGGIGVIVVMTKGFETSGVRWMGSRFSGLGFIMYYRVDSGQPL